MYHYASFFKQPHGWPVHIRIRSVWRILPGAFHTIYWEQHLTESKIEFNIIESDFLAYGGHVDLYKMSKLCWYITGWNDVMFTRRWSWIQGNMLTFKVLFGDEMGSNVPSSLAYCIGFALYVQWTVRRIRRRLYSVDLGLLLPDMLLA